MRNIAALFSILMPGFGQIYNRQFVKGVAFILLEHFDNMYGNINKAIYLDFNGLHEEAVNVLNYEGALFYAGFYVYVVWDAWYYAKEGANKTTTAIPFLIGGFLGVMATIYASKLPYPVLSIGLFMIIPMIVGMIVFRKE